MQNNNNAEYFFITSEFKLIITDVTDLWHDVKFKQVLNRKGVPLGYE